VISKHKISAPASQTRLPARRVPFRSHASSTELGSASTHRLESKAFNLTSLVVQILDSEDQAECGIHHPASGHKMSSCGPSSDAATRLLDVCAWPWAATAI
jgi:hypothetical protein